MDELKLELKNCYGIQEMDAQIDFSNNNVAIIYAPNGTMKSSLAKTFIALRDDIPVEEQIFGYKSECCITDENGVDVSEKEIIVINPFEENGFEDQGLLMANDTLRKKYLNIHKSIEEKKEALYAQIKNALGYSSRSGFDVKKTMLSDWCMNSTEEYACLSEIKGLLSNKSMACTLKEEELDYGVLFNDKVIAMLKAGNTSELIAEYEKKYRELVDKSLYMQQGIIDHNNYGNISDSLNSNGFFAANNEVILKAKDGSSKITVKEQKQLNDLIKKEKEQVLNTKEIKDIFEKINKAFAKNKDTQAFNSFLQTHQDIVPEYKNIDLFKKKVWVKAFGTCEASLAELLKEYDKAQFDLKTIRTAAQNEVTDWMKALELFKERFYVPFMIEPSNQADVILNMDLPSFSDQVRFTCVSMGNPHAICFIDDVKKIEIEKVGPVTENSSHFPNRTNVEFIDIVSNHEINMRVWERGVGETLACGTGACASVVASILNGYTERDVVVNLLGGKLEIEWKLEDNHVYLKGPARTIFEGEIDLD